MKSIIAVSIAVLLLAGCNNQPDIKPDEAIRLAKQAASLIQYPPAIYYSRGDTRAGANQSSYTADIRGWPDEVGFKAGTFNICGDGCYQPITFTTIITPALGGKEVDVTFASTWQGYKLHNAESTHAWHFHVYNDRRVEYWGEQGDKLPDIPQLCGK